MRLTTSQRFHQICQPDELPQYLAAPVSPSCLIICPDASAV